MKWSRGLTGLRLLVCSVSFLIYPKNICLGTHSGLCPSTSIINKENVPTVANLMKAIPQLRFFLEENSGLCQVDKTPTRIRIHLRYSSTEWVYSPIQRQWFPTVCEMHSYLNSTILKPEWLEALSTLPENNLGLVPSIHMAVQNCL